MTEESSLAALVGGYFHQDVFDVYEDEFAAATAFAASDPALAARLPVEVAQLLTTHPEDAELEAYLDELGCAIEPGPYSYRDWLTQIADHVRAATG